ncbi:hypothetical protein [Streptomyces gilvus]|uniref:hypothetical protein n=1 Tax=Streptomyces gilvus TaxID=2920937 RepID=UPI001F0F1B4A|nr:hypothetical protein [Streptomyces sp. CME 23]MCH5671397.1 hypothetical protein [Streptomyces sp. CME 23]
MADTRGFEVLTRAHAHLGEVVAGVPVSAWWAMSGELAEGIRPAVEHLVDRPRGP